MASTYWTGGSCGDFYTSSNWSTDSSPLTYHDVDITGTSATSTATAYASTVSTAAVPSLTIGNYGTLDITAHSCNSSVSSPVFSTSSFQVMQYGSIVIDTSSAVELGQFNELYGTMTIKNNNSNVFLTPDDRLNGTGTLNLENSTFGSQTQAINIANSLHLNLTGNSSIYTGFLATGATVSFDSCSTENFFLDGDDTTVGTQFTGVSAKTHFGITANSGDTPISASYEKNSDGTYSLVVQETNNHTLTLSDITPASGYTPGTLAITQDASGNYLISDTSASKSTDCSGHHGWHCGTHDKTGCDTHSWSHHDGNSSSNSGSSHGGFDFCGGQFKHAFTGCVNGGTWGKGSSCSGSWGFWQGATTSKGCGSFSYSSNSNCKTQGGSQSWTNQFAHNSNSCKTPTFTCHTGRGC